MNKVMGGTVTHPKDLRPGARKELGEKLYEELVKKHGEGFSAVQFVNFLEEARKNKWL